MSTELPQLSDADRAEIGRIRHDHRYDSFAREEAIARHFIDVGLERAAVICGAIVARYQAQGDGGEADYGMQVGASRCEVAIRAAKGQP